MDEIFDAHKNSIESRLWQMVRCFEVNADMSPSNINYTKELFALLNQRLQTMCQHVCSEKIARSSLVPSRWDDSDDDSQSGDLNQNESINNAPLQRPSLSDSDSISQHLVDFPLSVGQSDFHMRSSEYSDPKAAMGPSGSKSPVSDQVSEGGKIIEKMKPSSGDNLQQIQHDRSHLAVPDEEQSKSDQSPNGNKNSTKRQFVDQPVDNQMKKRPKTEITRPSHTIAILGASSTSSKMIRAFCFFCEEPLQMEYSAWKVHWLNHTGENTSSSSERCVQEESGLKGFMCKVCDHLQLNKVEAIKHLWQEHFKSPQEIHENL
ncbi:uncharacterized protein LOC116346180 isoform X2 [Contarinia nasturtii]|uniref:uncharacterized protein LOC116346180 isoform X2 n=1 Tax=Contarinia nasturtii TaxID=265458 RepID=UPI0012D39759|nr:uncharacterized protein LOC116346180 isoform X2 [Contarinia nasturtii]